MGKTPKIFKKNFTILGLKQRIIEHSRFENKLVGFWFIFKSIGVGAGPRFSEPQTFKKVSLQMLVLELKILSHIVQKNAPRFLMFDMKVKVEAEAVPFYRFRLPLLQKFAAFTASVFTSLQST